MKGVVAGVRDYGNKMGIPTVNGAIVFDKHFIGNPLVFCGNVGLIPKGKEIKKVNKGDLDRCCRWTHRPRRHPWRYVLFGRIDR